MEILHGANLAARFVLELSALSALGYRGYDKGGVALAAAAPLLGAAAWGAYVSPKAWIAAPTAVRFGVELLVFAAAVAGLLASGQRALALALGVAYAANRVILDLTGGTGLPEP